MDLITETLAGNRLALSRLLTQVENGSAAGQQALIELFPHTGRAHLVGVTGAPGTGKSTLVNRLAHFYRNPSDGRDPRQVAILAVDPSSPFSGGAILGDRIRMADLSGDPGVFIRSTASRGSLGGLTKTTAGLVQVFDAAGYEIVLIETVGAGQAEVDIARLAHTTLVIEAPGLGDDIQAIKAGILEIADVLVINKADRPGVEITERALRNMLNLAHPTPKIFRHHGGFERMMAAGGSEAAQLEPGTIWIPPIRRTVATEGSGINRLVEAIQKHYDHLHAGDGWKQRDRERIQNELDQHIQEELVRRWQNMPQAGRYQEQVERLVRRETSPAEAARELVE